jgi:polyhydroxyalkanoate synthase
MIWNNVVNNYLMGRRPPSFDLLYWNADSQNMPAAAHRDLVQFGLDNPLPHPGEATVLGTPVDLGNVTVDAYAVGAETDHLTPWQSCYKTVNLLGGDTRFVLSSSGHIAAIINPPGNPKARYQVAEEYPKRAEKWRAGAETRPGTWWEDWVAWLADRSGPLVPAPRKLGTRKHKIVGAAPGEYVLERAGG